MRHASRIAAALVLVAGLAGCNSIGEGNTIEKLEIVPVSTATQHGTFEQGDTYKLLECLRDEFIVLATFTDGTVANFSSRATWSTSDAAVVQVSNGDIPMVFVANNPADDGSFYESPDFNYAYGTVVPTGTAGQAAVVTARFAGLSASINLEIRKPTLRIVAAPADAAVAASTVYLGEGTQQRLTVVADVGGRTVKAGDLAGGRTNPFSTNPFRWYFPAGTFDPEDAAVDNDFDRWVVDDGSGTVATLHLSSNDGVVTGVRADYLPYEVVAESSLCPGSADPALRPATDVQVATFYDDPGTAADDRLVLSREAGFHGSGFAVEDVVIGSDQQMQLRGVLDANGDGSLFVEQHLNTQAGYLVLPLNSACQDSSALLGCTFNADFSVASPALVSARPAASEGNPARVMACLPLCMPPQATLEADNVSPGVGVTVNFTATALDPPAGTTVNYLFDFGDGTTLGPQASPMASHAYAAADAYTATVRLVDAAFPAEFLSQNAGAVRVLVDSVAAPGNNAPTAALEASLTSGDAPLVVTLDAGDSVDPDSGDALTVYEFDPGDGTPVIRQTQSSLVHVYVDGTGGPFTPTVRVYDEAGTASAAASAAAVTVNGTSPAFIRSNAVALRARDAKLCSIEVQPPLAAAPTEMAFTFPGLRFEAMGTFVADTGTAPCDNPVIGTQLVTRFTTWSLFPDGVTNETSRIAQVLNQAQDFQSIGQVDYLSDVAADTPLDLSATVRANVTFAGEDIEGSSSLTVTPCVGCTP